MKKNYKYRFICVTTEHIGSPIIVAVMRSVVSFYSLSYHCTN